MNQARDKAILVTGASGKLGRRAVELLLDAGVGRVIAGTRTPEKMAALQARGAEVRHLDFDDPATLKAAFHGVDRILMVSTDAARPGQRLAQHRAAIEAAVNAQVEYLAYTSYARSAPDSPIPRSGDHRGTEQALRESGLAHVALRNSIYADSVRYRVPSMLKTGALVGLAGPGGIAYVTREDCARAAAAAVALENPPSGALEITGPEVLNGARMVQLVNEITDGDVRYVALDPQALRAHLIAEGASESTADHKLAFEVAVAGGYLDFATDAVQTLTGRAPMHVRDYLLASGVGKAAA